MGIRGLKNYLASKMSGVLCPCVLPTGSVLVIDGDGWVFQLIEASAKFRPELGGCYNELYESITEEIKRLRACGLQLVAIFDGPNQRMKQKTASKRMEQHLEQWARFYDFCEDNVSFSDSDGFPLAPLCKKQLIACLKDCGVTMEWSDGEADQDIARLVHAGNIECAVGEEKFYAYGRDSDYLAMRSCPYIEFGTIEAVPIEKSSRPSPAKAAQLRKKPICEAFTSRVWRRSEICEALSITEDQFVDWALLIGNDYTADCSRIGDFDWTAATVQPKSLNSGFSPFAMEEALQAILSLGNSRLSSQEPGVEMTLQYSRAVYDLQPLDAFPFEAPTSAAAEAEDEEESMLAAQREEFENQAAATGVAVGPAEITRWFGSHGADEEADTLRQSLYFSDLRAYVREVTAAAQAGRQRRLGIAEHAVAYMRWKTSPSSSHAGHTQPTDRAEVSDNHLVALESMLKHMYAQAEDEKVRRNERHGQAGATPNGKSSRSAASTPVAPSQLLVPDESFPCRPRWKDVVASFAYQRACSLLLRLLPEETVRAKYNSPRHLYSGVYFHSVLRKMIASTAIPYSQLLGAGKGTPAPTSSAKKAQAAGSAPSTPSSADDDDCHTPPWDAPSLIEEEDAPAEPENEILPIDAFREEILQRIRRDRVTIIHGETGCGKSSCLPRFLLEDAEQRGEACRIMVSQPRRIAVTSLLRRLRPTLGKKVGMRMGHGVRDDFPETKIHYVTTGYLVRALAHQPDHFAKCSHLIIDEVHERSVDGDLVCLLARDILRSHPSIRIVLMSATIHTQLYRDYFAAQNDGSYGAMDCLSVGVRRFPVKIHYAEDLLQMPLSAFGGNRYNAAAFAPAIQSASKEIVAHTKGGGAESDVPPKLALAQYKAAVNLVRAIGAEGTGVLIFVSGINDITEIVQMFEQFPKYLLFPIHSDIPADEQEMAFAPTPADKVKVVVATNAAESSVTIPDCDVVICLGTHKSLQYSARNHRTQLVNTWISKASSTQRAGRTGRVRPGTVYRLYSKELFENMTEHEVAEVHRRPLQDVVLGMWVMLEDAVGFKGVTPFLQGLIEAPDMHNIEQSYQYLYESDLISHPSDEGFLTAVGRLSGELPVDIALGRMVAYGVMLGVAPEAIVLAAALTLPKAPFRYANPIFSEADEYNDIVRRKFLLAAEFDAGAYSEPIMLLRLLRHWRTLKPSQYGTYCHKRGLLQSVMKQFKSMTDHLAHTVASRLRPPRRGDSKQQQQEAPAVDYLRIGELTERKLNLLRLILFWSSSGNVLRMKEKNKKTLTDTSVLVHSSEVTAEHMQALYGTEVPYKLSVRGKRVYDAPVRYWSGANYFLPLVQLLDGLATLAAAEEAHCCWVVIKSNSNQSTMVTLVVPKGPSVRDVLGLLCTQVFIGQERLLCTGRDVAEALGKHCHCLGNSVVLVVPDASKSEMKRLNDFRDLLEGPSLAMLIPVIGNAKLAVSNCCPPEESIRALFFGEEGGPEEGPLACQVTHNRSVLTFPKEEWMGPEGDILGSDSDSEADSASVEVTAPLIDDLPLGHRLISCCQQQVGKSKQKHLVLKAAVTGTNKKAVPGSMMYANQHLSGDAEAAGAAAKSTDKLEVRLGCINPTWANLRALKTTPADLNQEDQHALSSVQAILSKQTLLSCSFHCGPESLFAVSHTTLLLGATGNLVACDGVTFLPPGASWIYLALACAGADTDQLLALCPDVAGELDMTARQTAAAAKVFELFRGATNIVQRDDIVALLGQAFAAHAGLDELDETLDSVCSDELSQDMALMLAELSLEGEDEEGVGDDRTAVGGHTARRAVRAGAQFNSAHPPSDVPLVVQQQRQQAKVKAAVEKLRRKQAHEERLTALKARKEKLQLLKEAKRAKKEQRKAKKATSTATTDVVQTENGGEGTPTQKANSSSRAHTGMKPAQLMRKNKPKTPKK